MRSSSNGNVYHLPRQRYEVASDPIFFHKTVVKVGSRFTHHGRILGGTIWVVNRIWTVSGSGYAKIRSDVANVRTLKDVLELRCEETGEFRVLRFEYMSYSAIWRLVVH